MSKKEKKPTSFRLSDHARELLTKIAAKELRSEGKTVEALIIAKAQELGITVD